ncbi:23S rRNA (uracil(747)-C(5))-methyltransferase RlmC [Limnobaculum parvum]|uniref:23S rRNA (uracil(747)-C(5))-methyltransferase RlmC n=1 Tax=Limnobaculum parvum TaxID=2172103 RepID=A0A2Y9TVL5_9GAMM|nr:23S rRNA (uracil(747)-C(5))-methyltransferase RlmC [Limnobaculum parvum]AWH87474.1 23S rRNA (uracil(747)-C(5))-methyltransferase RlmC [Limnobaculum parvum]
MQCQLHVAGLCYSCQWIDKPYSQQLKEKQQALVTLLETVPVEHIGIPVSGAEAGCRNKAKMVVSGSVERPVLGLPVKQGEAVDLCGCPLYPESMRDAFPHLKQFIARAGLTPYNVERKRGELKFILLTESRLNGGLMLRFVLRSETKLQQLRQALPWLQAQLPQLQVISVNIQPVHMAVLEGEQEVILTQQDVLEEQLNHIPLYIRPRSFFQTNPEVAAKLYATATEWVSILNIHSMWDLFCGVGGFGLHCAANAKIKLTGIEISAEAIECAKRSAAAIGLSDIEFDSLDSTQFARSKHQQNIPDLVLVNPPRRGIGEELCEYLNQMSPDWILYSSCNAQTMAKDIQQLTGYGIVKVQLFDMFPHTAHYEVLTLLQRIEVR